MDRSRSGQVSRADNLDSILSIGDILMLSQTAWKIGRAFSSGRRSSPAEFKAIESELNLLSKSLKSFAETLFAEDENMLLQADRRTQNGVATILLSCQQTLQDLESLVEQYQVIRRTETRSGYTVDRSWSELVLTNFGKMMWTTEGGDIHSLKTMLRMHTGTITLTVQALQEYVQPVDVPQTRTDSEYRNSVERLEEMVTPMADKIDDIHKRPDSNLNGKIEDVQNWVMTYAHINPPPPPSSHEQEGSIAGSMYSRSSSDPSERGRERPSRRANMSPTHERKPFSSTTSLRTPDLVGSEASSVASPLQTSAYGGSENSSVFDGYDTGTDARGPGSSLGSLREQEEADFGNPNPNPVYTQRRSSRSTGQSSSRKTQQDPRRSGMIARGGITELEGISQPPFFRQVSKDAMQQNQPTVSPDSELSMRTNSLSMNSERPLPPRKASSSSRSGPTSGASSTASRRTPQPYPDSIPVHDHSDDPIPVTTPPLDGPLFSGSRALRSAASNYHPAPSVSSGRSYSTSAPTVTGAPERTSTPDQEDFEHELFKNSAILCDLPAKLVDYTLPSKDEGRPWDLEMEKAAEEARICIVRKRNNINDTIRFTTSIWAISYDRSARMEQRLIDGDAIVPYSTYFSPEKVAVTIPTELRFHEANPKDPSAEPKKVNTSWVNYVFNDARASKIFQSVLFGRKLIAVFRTEKTLRVREGFKGAIAYQEQMCGMENLRLWEDEGSCGVLAMMHFSAHFKDGYLSFWLNNARDPVRVRDEGAKGIKIKGLDIPVDGTRGANGLMRRGSEGAAVMGIGLGTGKLGKEGRKLAGKKITGARIEFRTAEEKDDFIAFVNRVQDRMVSLPDWDEGSTRS
ncbi:MAG: hypothetical protein M1821_009107 [Bathelium mastoideum]|nr:MAG: hypothetical protein M1821_009107 [Bathelium mastoideum]KAI9689576.1 MAG: hypothetical protein M1822_010228 [Bathelium mastoideum]